MILEDTIRAVLKEQHGPLPFNLLALEVIHKLPEMDFYTIHDTLNQLLSEQTVTLNEEGRYAI